MDEVGIDEMSFEAALHELDAVAEQLEGEALPLEESLRLFERGQLLLDRCRQLLEAAEVKVHTLNVEEL